MKPDIIPFPRRPVIVADSSVSVLVISHDPAQAERLSNDVQGAGFTLKRCGSVDAALQILGGIPTDLCVIGTLPPGDTLSHLAGQIASRGWSTQLLQVVSEYGVEGTANALLPAGASALPWPCSLPLFHALLTSSAQRARILSENRRLKRQLCNRNLREMVGQSPAMQLLRQSIQSAAEQVGAVLLFGESGTGIDLAAQAIHEASRRSHRPFLRIDCRVLSAEALETELWGVASLNRDANTIPMPGRLQQADGGTLFFDGIEHLPQTIQRRLVTIVRQQRTEHPVTGEPMRCDVRIIAGTNASLEQLVAKNLFRGDLREALAETTLETPSLRDRREDIAGIVEQFLHRCAMREGRPVRALTVEALNVLKAFDWPGNVRQLESVIDRACGLDGSTRLTAEMVQPWIERAADEDEEVTPGMTLADMERKLIEATFNRFEGNREKTAKALQIGIRTLSGKLRDYGYPPRGGPGSNRQLAAAPGITIRHDDFEKRAA